MKVVSLQSENVKRIKAVRIKPDGAPFVVIGGNNGQGKTSVLDSIEWAIRGKRALPEEPVRRGEERASVALDLGDLMIRRTTTPDGRDELVLEEKNGARPRAPQSILDRLYGKLSFDPIAFARMAPAQQAEELRKLAGLDLAALDGKIAGAMDRRRDANRELERLNAAITRLDRFEGVPPKERINTAALFERQEAHRSRVMVLEDARRAVEAADRSAETLTEDLAELERRAIRIKALLANVASDQASFRGALAEAEKAVAEGDPGDVGEQLLAAEQQNLLFDAARRLQAALEERDLAREAAEAREAELEALRLEKRRAIENAALPVEGLGLSEDGQVVYQGFPLDQASEAEKLRVSVAMGMAMHPGLHVLLIRDASLLDDASVELMRELAEGNGYQVWLERVGDKDPGAVVIEDGEVREPPAGAGKEG